MKDARAEQRRDRRVVTMTVLTPKDEQGRARFVLDWWCSSQARWRGQVFYAALDVWIPRLRREYPGRVLRVVDRA